MIKAPCSFGLPAVKYIPKCNLLRSGLKFSTEKEWYLLDKHEKVIKVQRLVRRMQLKLIPSLFLELEPYATKIVEKLQSHLASTVQLVYLDLLYTSTLLCFSFSLFLYLSFLFRLFFNEFSSATKEKKEGRKEMIFRSSFFSFERQKNL